MLPSSKVEIIQKKLLTYFKGETKTRKSLLDIKSKGCVRTVGHKFQKIIDEGEEGREEERESRLEQQTSQNKLLHDQLQTLNEQVSFVISFVSEIGEN